MSRLSPEDLCHLAQTNRYFRGAASDPGIWRALSNHRWSNKNNGPGGGDVDDTLADGTFNTTNRWKEMYLQRDGAEVAVEARRAPEEARDMFLAMAAARRSEPLSPRAAERINPLLGTALAERVAAFRRIRGLSTTGNTITQDLPGGSSLFPNSPVTTTTSQLPTSPAPAQLASSSAAATAAASGVTCSEGCSFVELEPNYWICEKGGHVHICGHSCSELQIDTVSETLVCSLTGRCFPRLMSEWEETGGRGAPGHGVDGEDQATGDWNAQDGMGGRLGRAFYAGYNAKDEKEMQVLFGIRM